jgi:histone H3/H4
VYDAYQRLQVTTIRDIYTKEHIDGLGENFLRERVRQQALKTYQEYLERYAIEQIITLVVNDASLQSQPVKELRRLVTNDTNKDVIRAVTLPETFDELFKRYRQLEKDWFERVTHGLDKDNERGRAIFDDYDDAHPIDKGFTEWEKARVEEKLRRLGPIAKSAKPE